MTSLLKEISWRPTSGVSWHKSAFEYALDLDVQGERVLLLGLRRDHEGRIASDGAIAWIGSLVEDALDLRPVHYSLAGAGAPTMNDCGILGSGAVRFLEDGTFVVIPGVEPGIYHYSADGTLLDARSVATLGVDTSCSYAPEERARFFADEGYRRQLLATKRATVEDILPMTGSSFGVITRKVEAGRTHWWLEIFEPTAEKPVSCEIPLEASATEPMLNHLRGDVDGDRILLLMAVEGDSRHHERPAVPPSIFLLRLKDPTLPVGDAP